MPQPPGRLLTSASVAVMILIWGTTWAAIRIGLEDLPPLVGLSLRFLLAGFLLIAFALALRIPLRPPAGEAWVWAVHAVCAFMISYSVTYWAEQWVPSGLTAVLFATFPLFVAVGGHFVLPGERLGPLAAAGILLGFAGVAVIFSEDFARLGGPRVATAAAVMLLSPFAGAVGNVVVKRWGRGSHPVSLNALAMAGSGALLGVAALAFEADRPVRFTATAVGSIVYLAVLGSALAFCLYFWLLRTTPAYKLALVAYFIPIVALVVGWLAFGEPVTARTLAGSALVVVGVALSVGR